MGTDGCDDFAALKAPATSNVAESAASVSKAPAKGTKRPWLMAFETMPAQMLNVYGAAAFPNLKDEDVWTHLNQPQKTGAIYMTEYCSKEVERRGIAVNRWLHAQLLFCKYQDQKSTKDQNKFVLSSVVFAELYAEIARILPSLEYCLAPKKQFEKKAGAASLRTAGVSSIEVAVPAKDPGELDRHGKVLYEWIDKQSSSRIRMLQNYQACGGLSFVAAVHHRATRCFRYCGNLIHSPDAPEVTMTSFQECIKSRHAAGSRGMEQDQNVGAEVTRDFS